jgi:hypothetical protein
MVLTDNKILEADRERLRRINRAEAYSIGFG